MDLGVTMFMTDRTMRPDDLARAVEERGLALALGAGAHPHPDEPGDAEPVRRATLPEEYARTLDPFVALIAAAAVTTHPRVGTGIALVAQRDPIVTAKEVATLDLLSGGRFCFGIGFGWNVEEMSDHGTAKATGGRIGRERVLAMQRLWADDEARSQASTCSSRRRGPGRSRCRSRGRPVLDRGRGRTDRCSATSPSTPTGGSRSGARASPPPCPSCSKAWAEAGREGQPIVTPFGTDPGAGQARPLRLPRRQECVLRLPSAGAEEILPILDRFAEFVD